MLSDAGLTKRDKGDAIGALPVLPHPATPDGDPLHPVDNADSGDATTRRRVLDLVAAYGPISASDIAAVLDITPAGVRRHVDALLARDHIAATDVEGSGAPKRRGRPARTYVITEAGRAAMPHRADDVAATALRYVAERLGTHELSTFITSHVVSVEERYRPVVEAAGTDVLARAHALAQALAADGYAASARPAPRPGFKGVQICQGHCPVHALAQEFPQFCEAETAAFSRLLGVHVQRLATLAAGERVCTTYVPLQTVTEGSATSGAESSTATAVTAPSTPTALERTVR